MKCLAHDRVELILERTLTILVQTEGRIQQQLVGQLFVANLAGIVASDTFIPFPALGCCLLLLLDRPAPWLLGGVVIGQGTGSTDLQ